MKNKMIRLGAIPHPKQDLNSEKQDNNLDYGITSTDKSSVKNYIFIYKMPK
jgi:hypothetical protein